MIVAGAGSIGIGVARSFASAGFDLTVLSRDPKRLEGLLPTGVALVSELPPQPPDLVVESIPEKTELKLALYEAIESRYAGGPILASNTSRLLLDDLAAGLRHPERFLGMHYLYPADMVEFVEVTRTRRTSGDAVAAMNEALRRCSTRPSVFAATAVLLTRIEVVLPLQRAARQIAGGAPRSATSAASSKAVGQKSGRSTLEPSPSRFTSRTRFPAAQSRAYYGLAIAVRGAGTIATHFI